LEGTKSVSSLGFDGDSSFCFGSSLTSGYFTSFKSSFFSSFLDFLGCLMTTSAAGGRFSTFFFSTDGTTGFHSFYFSFSSLGFSSLGFYSLDFYSLFFSLDSFLISSFTGTFLSFCFSELSHSQFLDSFSFFFFLFTFSSSSEDSSLFHFCGF